MDDSHVGFITIGFLIGLLFSVFGFLFYKDFLMQQCENQLIQQNEVRSNRCSVLITAIVKESE